MKFEGRRGDLIVPICLFPAAKLVRIRAGFVERLGGIAHLKQTHTKCPSCAAVVFGEASDGRGIASLWSRGYCSSSAFVQ